MEPHRLPLSAGGEEVPTPAPLCCGSGRDKAGGPPPGPGLPPHSGAAGGTPAPQSRAPPEGSPLLRAEHTDSHGHCCHPFRVIPHCRADRRPFPSPDEGLTRRDHGGTSPGTPATSPRVRAAPEPALHVPAPPPGHGGCRGAGPRRGRGESGGGAGRAELGRARPSPFGAGRGARDTGRGEPGDGGAGRGLRIRCRVAGGQGLGEEGWKMWGGGAGGAGERGSVGEALGDQGLGPRMAGTRH